MMTIFPVVLTVIAAGLLIVIARRPDEFRTVRSAMFPASPEALFAYVNDLRKFQVWSPWARLDPTAKTTFEGPPEGTGAVFRWAGNVKVGAGSMTIIESRPVDVVRMRLEFLKPLTATNTAEFTFTQAGTGTQVTWSMTGRNNFVSKAFGLFVDCDKMVGAQFESGLANMRAVMESAGERS